MTKLLVAATTGVVVASGISTPALAATPGVSAVTPANGATGVPITVHPTVTFTAAVNPSSVRYSFVKTVGGADVSGYYGYDAASRTLTLTPRAVLAYGMKYTVTIKVKDASGKLSSPYIWSFTTVSLDTTAPTRPGTPVAGTPGTSAVGLSW